MVILVHTTGLGFGRFGVQLFFVISGYLLANFHTNQTKFEFITHRFFRLFPLSLVFLIIFYIDSLPKYDEKFLNLLLLQNLWGGFNTFPCGWSISCEWIFSIFIVFLIPYKLKTLINLLILSSVLQILSGIYIWSNGGINIGDKDSLFKSWVNTTNPYINLGFFIAGILIYLLKDKFLSVSNWKLYLPIFSMIFVDQFIGHFMFGWQIAIPCLFLICQRIQIKSAQVIKFLEFIGKRTYGIFFCHLFVFTSSLNIESLVLTYVDFPYFGSILSFFINYLVAVIGGIFCYKFIEKPGLLIGKKIFNKVK